MEDLLKEIEELKQRVQELEMERGSNDLLDNTIVRTVAPYFTGAPTADGGVPVVIDGVRYNLLVDKIS